MKEIDKLKLQVKNYSKENEILKAELELYENGVYFSSENDRLEAELDLYKDNNKDLNDRIDNAIEYIEDMYYEDLFDDTLTNFQDKLLNILKGGKEYDKDRS